MLKLYANIKERRIALGMSQDELAKKVGYSTRSMIAHIEHGQINLPQSKIIAFADALHTTPGDLMGDVDEPYVMNKYQQDVIGVMDFLTEDGQKMILEYASLLSDSGKYNIKIED